MTGRTIRFLIATGAVLCFTAVNAQVPRDRAVFVSTGEASIAGTVVVDATDARPLSRAVVTAMGSALQPSRWTVTDEAGKFSFTGLPPGNVTISVSKAGYMTTTFGQKRSGKGSGVVLSLVAGQRVNDVNVRLARGAVITGTIRDESGAPRRALTVFVQEKRQINGEIRLINVVSLNTGFPTTDDHGVYRAYGLAAGDYVVSASLPVLPDAGAAMDLRQPTAAEVLWANAQLRARGTPGPAAPQQPPPAPGQALASVPLYFPGTPDVRSASTITVRAGEERGGVDFAVSFVPATRVSGLVFGPDGVPARGVQVAATLSGNPIGLRASGRAMTATDANGAFTLGGIPPGSTTLTARNAGARGRGPGGQQGGAGFWADAEIVASGSDITGVTLALRPGMNIAGRVVLDGDLIGVLPELPAARVTLIAVSTTALAPVVTQPAQVQADGKFLLAGVVPGRYRLSATVLLGREGAARWTLKSATIGTRDASDVPFEVTPGTDISGAIVTLTNRAAEISGKLLDAAGRPTPDYYVVVFSTDRNYWVEGSRRLRPPVRPSSDGTYRISPLLPGSYYFAALADVDQEDLYDREFLEQVAAGALTITLADGEKKIQDLKLAGR